MSRQRVLLVDDHALVRAGIRGLIDQLGDFVVVAETDSIADALAQAAAYDPDIVVTDLSLRRDNGMDLVSMLHASQPDLPVLVLSMHGTEAHVTNAIRRGASGYVAKEGAPSELGQALRSACRGECYVSPLLTGSLLRQSLQAPRDGAGALTQRQRQILGLIGAGKSTKQIGFELGLSEKTIAAHRAQIGDRVGIRDRVALAMYALEQGLVGGT